jgi:acyl carrier protein
MVMPKQSNAIKEQKIIDFIAWELNIPISKLNPNTDFVDDLCLDPIDRDLLIAKLENHTGVYLNQEEAARIATVRDARRYLLA